MKPSRFRDPNTPVARHDRMVALVTQMLDLHRQLAAEGVPHEVAALQRRIDLAERLVQGEPVPVGGFDGHAQAVERALLEGLHQAPDERLRAWAVVLAEFARLAKPARRSLEQLPEPLSEREEEILRLLAAGANNRQIAGQLFLAEGTVKNYVSTILNKLGVEDRTQAALRGRELGVL